MKNAEKELTVYNKTCLSKRIKKDLGQNKYLYFMMIPIVIYFVLFAYLPMYGAIIAFKDYKVALGVFESKWVGLQWFYKFMTDLNFTRVFKNTLIISIYSILWGFPAPIIFALFMNEIPGNKFRRTVQTVTYLPHFISMVVVCGLLKQFCDTGGFISNIAARLTGTSTNLLNDPDNFRTIYVASGIWQEIGYGSIIYLSALTAIDPTLYEAAEIDGAGRLRRIWHISIPGVLPTIVVMFILRMGSVMTVGYEKIMLLYSPFTYVKADVISTYVYRIGIGEGNNFSYASAIGLFNSIINVVAILLSNWISKKLTNEALW